MPRLEYERINWENAPSTETPLNAENLNIMDNAIAALFSYLEELEQRVDNLSQQDATDMTATFGEPGEEGVDDAPLQPSGSSIGNIITGIHSRMRALKNTEIPELKEDVTALQNALPGMISDEMDDKFGQEIGDNVTSWLTEHVDPVGSAVVVDDTLSIEGAAADAKKTGDELTSLKEDLQDIEEEISHLDGLSENVKQALLQIASKVAYIDEDGQDYYDDLYNALYEVTAIHLDAQSIMLTSIGSTQQLTATTTPIGGAVTWASSDTSIATVSNTGLVTSVGYGSCTVTASSGSVSASCAVAVSQVTLTSIAADYQQSGTVYDTASLDSLKSDLTVIATYSDSSTATVTEYTLSGTLTVGTSTVTVSYGGKTATFNVTVTAVPTLSSISLV